VFPVACSHCDSVPECNSSIANTQASENARARRRFYGKWSAGTLLVNSGVLLLCRCERESVLRYRGSGSGLGSDRK
jgi:hypothetical protein